MNSPQGTENEGNLFPTIGCTLPHAFRSLQRMAPKLSIITVTYNAAKFIEPTILSIGAQNVTDREFIVVEGLSNDYTVSILEKHDQIVTQCSSEKDAGLYDAMNKASRMAKGKYVMFLNAGD